MSNSFATSATREIKDHSLQPINLEGKIRKPLLQKRRSKLKIFTKASFVCPDGEIGDSNVVELKPRVTKNPKVGSIGNRWIKSLIRTIKE